MSLVVLVVITGCGSSNKENMDLYTPVIEQYAKVTEQILRELILWLVYTTKTSLKIYIVRLLIWTEMG